MEYRRVLAVAAHPGDADFEAGATLVRLTRAGAHVVLVICTDAGHTAPRPEGASCLRFEALRAGDVLGLAEVSFLEFPEGLPSVETPLLWTLLPLLDKHRPDLVLAQDPTNYWTEESLGTVRLGLTDHRAAGRVTLEALHPRSAGRRLARADTRPPRWAVREVWLYDTPTPNHFIETAATRELKRAAIACFESQGALRLQEEADAREDELTRAAGFSAEGFRKLQLF